MVRGADRAPEGNAPSAGGSAGGGWKLALKLVVTVGLLMVIFWQVDWADLVRTFRMARLSLVGIVALLMMLSVTISAYKWQQLLRIHGLRHGLGKLHRWYFIATFFNNFLPTSIGGDGYRVLKTLGEGRRAGAVMAVTMERVSGLAVLSAMAYAAGLLLWLRDGNELARWFVYFATVGGVLTLGMLAVVRFTGWTDRLLAHPRCPGALRSLWHSLGDFGSQPGRAAWALGGVSLLFHVHTLFFYWLLLLAMGSAVDPLALLVILAVTAIASVLPISLAGIGVIEGSFVYSAMQFGIDYEAALSAILMVRGIRLLQSGIGAVLYFRGDRGLAATTLSLEDRPGGLAPPPRDSSPGRGRWRARPGGPS